MRGISLLSGAMLGALAGGAASAQAVNVPPRFVSQTAPVSGSGFYIWADGTYQSVGLPSYDLGWRRYTPAPTTDRGPRQTHEPRADGFGSAVAIGYILPHGTIAFGERARIELGGKYVSGTATNAATDPATGGIALQYVGGIIPVVVPGLALQNCSNCTVSSTLSSEVAAWQLHAKAATDVKALGVTFTPSVALFGGGARNAQSFSQTMGNPAVTYSYVANSSVRWTDWGGRAGLDAAADLADWLSMGVGGTLGWARRSANMSADDAAVFPFAVGTYLQGSTASASATTTSLVANAETNLLIRMRSNIAMKLFAGWNYDSHVPGISAPRFWIPFPVGEQQTPSSLKFEAESSYYAGASLAVPFLP